jgi:DMSO reductase family type II enzyme chaperone
MKTMEEAVRFYNHFGLTLSESPHELPDHLTTELEFLHFLAFREAQSLEQGDDPGAYQRAQRDFLARHLGRWIPKMREKMERKDPMPFFLELVRRLESFLMNDGAHLVAVAGPPPPPSATPNPRSDSKPH